MTKKEQIKKLRFQLVNVFEIYCDRCSHTHTSGATDAKAAAKFFYSQGWTIDKGRCLCPDCTKDIFGSNAVLKRQFEGDKKNE